MLGRMVVKAILKNPGVSLWTLGALTTCAILAALFATMAMEVQQKMSGELRHIGANAVVYPITSPASSQSASTPPQVDWPTIETLLQTRGVKTARVALRVGLIEGRPVAVAAANPQSLTVMTGYWSVTGRRPSGSDEVMAGRSVAKMLGLSVGGRINIQWLSGESPGQYQVVGIFESGDEDEDRLFVPPGSLTVATAGPARFAQVPVTHPQVPGVTAGRYADCLSCHAATDPKIRNAAPLPLSAGPTGAGNSLPMTSDFGYLLMSVPGDGSAIRALEQAINNLEQPVQLKPLQQVLYGERHMLTKINLLAGLTLTAVAVLTAMGVCAAVLARVVQRRKELALLQSLGATRWAVGMLLLLENTAMGVVAAASGFVLGTALAQGVVWYVFHANVQPRVAALAAATGVTLGVCLLAGWLGARRASRLQPAAILRGD